MTEPPAEGPAAQREARDRRQCREAPPPPPARKRLIEALALSALLSVATQAGAEPDPMRGADLFAHHCAMCHGTDARGGGPLAPALILQPADLTALGRGDAFPVFRVVARIDGRDPLVAHGSPMPVWGDWFEGPQVALRAASGQPILTSAPVADLAAYLATLRN
jgi:mono/diheme cytochrome c family protein